MTRKLIYFFTFAVFLSACSPHSPELRQVLRLAGHNRAELEKVLAHFQHDELKLKAAKFLILNMPYHFSFSSDLLSIYHEKIYATALAHNRSGVEAMAALAQKYGQLNLQELEIVHDIRVITADLLIRNIEHAFYVWQTKPWAQHVSFEEFKETILPYRIRTETLTDWREAYYNHFMPIVDSLMIDTNSPLKVIQTLWDYIQSTENIFSSQKIPGYPDALTLLSDRYLGDCFELAYRGLFIMRALGIPGGIGSYLQHPYSLNVHVWNFILDSDGTFWKFSMNGDIPRPARKEHPMTDRVFHLGRVYHHTFARQQGSLPIITQGTTRTLPRLLRNAFIKDVSEHYLHDVSIRIPVSKEKLKDTILYLCTFSSRGWTPIAWTLWNREEEAFIFDFVEINTLYLPAHYIDGRIVAVSNPGSVNDEGAFIQVPLDMSETQTLVLERKFPFRPHWAQTLRRIIGGKFQASNSADFRNAVTLHTFTDKADMRWHHIDIQTNTSFRYFRFLSGDNGYNNMAEIQVFDRDGRRISGEVIGTEGSFRDRTDNRRDAVFDNDPLTFFHAAEPSGAWAGLDFGAPKRIGRISYLFRNDDNSIRTGDVYELFFWNKTHWQSLGRQTGKSEQLVFENAPIDALFWLRNHTRGVEELPFFYRNGEQIFWNIF